MSFFVVVFFGVGGGLVDLTTCNGLFTSVQMIEVVASMARGPVLLAGEVMVCLITFTNPMSHLSTSATR